MKELRFILRALVLYLSVAVIMTLLLSLIAYESDKGTELLGYFASLISFLSGFSLTIFLKDAGRDWKFVLIFILITLSLSALSGYIIGVLNLSGTISSVMFTVCGYASAMIIAPKSRKRSTRLKSLHKL